MIEDKIIQISACGVEHNVEIYGLSENGNLYRFKEDHGWVLIENSPEVRS